MSLIEINNLTFAYDGNYDNVFENLTLKLDSDWKLGLIGRNGKGKTTLFKLLAGQYEYQGSINASVEFDYFPFELKWEDDTAIDMYHEICPGGEDWEYIKETFLLGVKEDSLYVPMQYLSLGEKCKLAMAALFLKENNFLLIDEPANHLDMFGREVMSKYLNKKKGFILVSHDRAFLDNCIDHTLALNKNSVDLMKGNFSDWNEYRTLKNREEAEKNERLKKDIKRLSESSKRASSWSDKVEKSKYGTLNSGIKVDRGYLGHKAEKMMRRSKAIQNRTNKLIEEKSGLIKDIERLDYLALKPLEHHADKLWEIKDGAILYGDRQVCAGVNFSVNQGERVRLSGKNGSGKSSILKLIVGEEISYRGEVNSASNLKISYVSQDASSLSGNLSDYARKYEIDESLFKSILIKFGFYRNQFDKDMSEFSSGQKKKTELARSVCESAHLYVWDEPLNYIDLLSRMQIENLIKDSKATIVFVEHDAAFSNGIGAKVAQL